jgi:hypothetical protein
LFNSNAISNHQPSREDEAQREVDECQQEVEWVGEYGIHHQGADKRLFLIYNSRVLAANGVAFEVFGPGNRFHSVIRIMADDTESAAKKRKLGNDHEKALSQWQRLRIASHVFANVHSQELERQLRVANLKLAIHQKCFSFMPAWGCFLLHTIANLYEEESHETLCQLVFEGQPVDMEVCRILQEICDRKNVSIHFTDYPVGLKVDSFRIRSETSIYVHHSCRAVFYTGHDPSDFVIREYRNDDPEEADIGYNVILGEILINNQIFASDNLERLQTVSDFMSAIIDAASEGDFRYRDA